VELDELHVHEPAARVESQVHAVAVVLVATRGAPPPDARVTAGREDDRVGQMNGAFAGVQVEGERAEARLVCHEQPRDILVLLDADAELGGLRRDRPQDGSSRVIAGVARSPPAVGAEEALVKFAVFRARELAPPGGELEHGARRLAGHDLDHPRMSEEVALAQGVGEVLLPRVLRIARPKCRIDATRRERRVGV
jgi:hypothetical protein